MASYKDIYFDWRMRRGRHGWGQWKDRVTNLMVKGPAPPARIEAGEYPTHTIKLTHQQKLAAGILFNKLSKDFPKLAKFAGETLENIVKMRVKMIESKELVNRDHETLSSSALDAEADILRLIELARKMAASAGVKRELVTGGLHIPAPLGFPEAQAFMAQGQGITALQAVRYLTGAASKGIDQGHIAFLHGQTFILADQILRLGKFLSDKAAAGYLIGGSGGSAIAFSFNEGLAAFEAVVGSLATDEGALLLAGDAAVMNRDRIIQEYINQLRLKMGTKNVSAFGANYSAPISNTGRLANTIDEIRGHPSELKPKDLRGGAATAVIATIGIGKSGRYGGHTFQPPKVYGEVLAKASGSSPPSNKLTMSEWFGGKKDSFREWGHARGLSNEIIDRIMVKVFREGTYGRAWMAQIAADLEPWNIEFIGEAMKKQIDDFLRDITL